MKKISKKCKIDKKSYISQKNIDKFDKMRKILKSFEEFTDEELNLDIREISKEDYNEKSTISGNF